MDDELKRFEDKQKIANLQIDKRLAMIENAIDELKTGVESISANSSSGQVSKLEKEVSSIKKDEEDHTKKGGFNYLDIVMDFDELKRSFTDLRVRFEEKVSEVVSLQEQLVGFERRGKLPQCENGFAELEYKVKFALEKLDMLEKKISYLERVNFSNAVSQPIIIE